MFLQSGHTKPLLQHYHHVICVALKAEFSLSGRKNRFNPVKGGEKISCGCWYITDSWIRIFFWNFHAIIILWNNIYNKLFPSTCTHKTGLLKLHSQQLYTHFRHNFYFKCHVNIQHDNIQSKKGPLMSPFTEYMHISLVKKNHELSQTHT